MKLTQQEDKVHFTISGASFGEIKMIRDALKAHAKGGAAAAAKMAAEIEAALDSMQV
jgi:hypothetical protein